MALWGTEGREGRWGLLGASPVPGYVSDVVSEE